MSKHKINFDIKSKLDKVSEHMEKKDEETTKVVNIIPQAIPMSFRLRPIDAQRMEEVLEKVNQVNQSHPFNRAYLIRGLLMLATQTKPERIMQAIREAL